MRCLRRAERLAERARGVLVATRVTPPWDRRGTAPGMAACVTPSVIARYPSSACRSLRVSCAHRPRPVWSGRPQQPAPVRQAAAAAASRSGLRLRHGAAARGRASARRGAAAASAAGASAAVSGSASGKSSAGAASAAARICRRIAGGAVVVGGLPPLPPPAPALPSLPAAIASAASSSCRSLSDKRERSMPFSLAMVWSTVSEVMAARLA